MFFATEHYMKYNYYNDLNEQLVLCVGLNLYIKQENKSIHTIFGADNFLKNSSCVTSLKRLTWINYT